MCEKIIHRHVEYVACTLIITNHCTHQDLQVGMYNLCLTVTLTPAYMLLLKTVCYSILQKNICPVYQSLSKLFCPCGILQTTECSLLSNILQTFCCSLFLHACNLPGPTHFNHFSSRIYFNLSINIFSFVDQTTFLLSIVLN